MKTSVEILNIREHQAEGRRRFDRLHADNNKRRSKNLLPQYFILQSTIKRQNLRNFSIEEDVKIQSKSFSVKS
jgi:hypothetical protein